MAFGPVSADGGERRLNVLFTRARSRCEIYVSFAYGDITWTGRRRRSTRPQTVPSYAKSGVLEERVSTSEDANSPFEETVSRIYRDKRL